MYCHEFWDPDGRWRGYDYVFSWILCISTALFRAIYYRFPDVFPLFSHRERSLADRADFGLTHDSSIEDFHSYFFRLYLTHSITRWSLSMKNNRRECRLTILIPKTSTHAVAIMSHQAGIGVRSPMIPKQKRKIANIMRIQRGRDIIFW